MQKLVNLISQRFAKLDIDRDELKDALIDLSDFWHIETEEKDTVPFQFQRNNQKTFKKYSHPISESMWAVNLVANEMRKELYPFELGTGTPNVSSAIQIQEPEPTPTTKVEVNTAKTEPSIMDKLKKTVARQPQRDPNSPYALMQENIRYFSMIEQKWHLILHWYGISVYKSPKKTNKVALQNRLENIIITFDRYIEPNLLKCVHYANEILKNRTEQSAITAISAHLLQKQRKGDQPPPPH